VTSIAVSGQATARICVVSPYDPAPSETFIRRHVSDLPGSVVLVHGWRPRVDTRTVLSLPERLAHKVWRSVSGEGLEREWTAAYGRAFRRHRADAVLAEYGPTGVNVMAACRALGLPLVVHFHGFDASVRDVLDEYGSRYRAMFAQAAAVIAVSHAMRISLVAMGAPAEKVVYNPCGVDCREFGGAAPADAPPVFLSVGRFVAKKAPQLTIAAFAEACRQQPEMRLRMIGDGPLLDDCRALARQLGVAPAVTFLGYQPPAVVQREMRAARGFVQHSIEAPNGDREGTPVGILEAGASGLPTVATRHGGIPDVVIDGETGFLVEEQDVVLMAARLAELARSPELAGGMGGRARARIRSQFSRERSLDTLWDTLAWAIRDSIGTAQRTQVCSPEQGEHI
jgi:glycosyltransferase involved in cell wall biosynthesis